MRSIWINGWSLSASYLQSIVSRQFSDHEVEVINPGPNWQNELESRIDLSDTLIGYSTGTFLLAGTPTLLERAKRVIFFAPFADFRAEANLGSRVRKAQLIYLLRWLKRDPPAAVKDFREKAGIVLEETEIDSETLVWGIEQLLHNSSPDIFGDYECYIGEGDTLLDSVRLKELYPNINVVPNSGHDIGELLERSSFTL